MDVVCGCIYISEPPPVAFSDKAGAVGDVNARRLRRSAGPYCGRRRVIERGTMNISLQRYDGTVEAEGCAATEPALELDVAADRNAAVTELRRLLNDGEVEAARALATVSRKRWPDDETLKNIARVIAPPRAWVVGGGPDRFRTERAWVRRHGKEYERQWLAVCGEELLAHGRTKAEVLSAIQSEAAPEAIYIHYEPTWSAAG